MIHKSLIAAPVIAFASLLSQSIANAEVFTENATAPCQGARSTFDQYLRKRPTAISNEGTATVFLSCSPISTHDVSVINAAVLFRNNSAAPVTISCTMVNGRASFAPLYYPKTQTIEPGLSNYMVWNPWEFGQTYFFDQINFSCGVPPGVDLELTYITTDDF